MTTTLLYGDAAWGGLEWDGADLETLQLLALSLTDVPAHEQLLTVDGVGELTPATLPPADGAPALLVCLTRLPDRADYRSLALAPKLAPGAGGAVARATARCTQVPLPFTEVAQPRLGAPSLGDAAGFCAGCAAACLQGVPGLRAQPPPLGGGDPGGAFACACAQRGSGACLFEGAYGADTPTTDAADWALRLMLAAAAVDVAAQHGVAGAVQASGEPGGAQALAQRLAGQAHAVREYGSAALQREVLRVVPLAELTRRTAARRREQLQQQSPPQQQQQSDAGAPGTPPFQDAFLRVLVEWFKADFFTWVNAPPCGGCGRGDHMAATGGSGPTTQEERDGGAGHVEVYACRLCGASTRFPRYNSPAKLLSWRRGRCGEWANAFTAIAVALGYDARYVLDFTDHVWTEVWLAGPRRYVHVDACEAAVDSPLLYEAGWGKRLSYVFALGSAAVVDVTRRYTRQWGGGDGGICARRTLCSEATVAAVVRALDAVQRAAHAPPGPLPRGVVDEVDLSRVPPHPPAHGAATAGSAAPLFPAGGAVVRSYRPGAAWCAELGTRLAAEAAELDATTTAAAATPPVAASTAAVPAAAAGMTEGLVPHPRPEELVGRTTGSVEWRAARGELGASPAAVAAAAAAAAAVAAGAVAHDGAPSPAPATTADLAATAPRCGLPPAPPTGAAEPSVRAATASAHEASGLPRPLVQQPQPPRLRGAGAQGVEAAAAAQTALQARTMRLFRQLMLSAEASAPPCAHPHCARNPAVGALPPSQAGLRALQLAMSVAAGGDGAALLCGCSAPPAGASPQSSPPQGPPS